MAAKEKVYKIFASLMDSGIAINDCLSRNTKYTSTQLGRIKAHIVWRGCYGSEGKSI